jgi:hypothetical protein
MTPSLESIVFFNELSLGADGWAQIAPFGDFPGMATEFNGDGTVKRRVKAIQRIDRAAAESMVGHFKSVPGKIKRFLRGLPIYVGHPDAPAIGDRYPNKAPVGTFSDLRVSEAGLYGLPVFTNEGLAELEATPRMGLSGRWSAEEVGIENGERVFRPVMLKSAGLTPNPNLPVELLNECESGSAGEPRTRTERQRMKEKIIAWLKTLGIELANEAPEDAVQTALGGVAVKLTETAELANGREAEISTLKGAAAARDKELGSRVTELETLRVEFQNERKARIGLLLDQAVREGRITAAQRPEWAGKLTADFANETEQLARVKPTIKTAAATEGMGGRKVEIANSRERIAKVQDLVAELQGKGLSYDAAFARVRQEHAALFEQMHVPETR